MIGAVKRLAAKVVAALKVGKQKRNQQKNIIAVVAAAAAVVNLIRMMMTSLQRPPPFKSEREPTAALNCKLSQ